MSQVNVTINGRQFRMACEDGQESRVTDLARDLDARIESLRAKFGEIGDTRLTVMAALTVADELAEMGLRVKRLEQELAALQDARVSAGDRNKAAQAAVAAALAAQFQALDTDRARLASELDHATARSRGLEAANREVAQRIDLAIETIRRVLADDD